MCPRCSQFFQSSSYIKHTHLGFDCGECISALYLFYSEVSIMKLSHCSRISPWLCVVVVLSYSVSGFTYITGKLFLLIPITTTQSMLCLKWTLVHVVFTCWNIIPPEYHHYAELLDGVEHIKCLTGIFCREVKHDDVIKWKQFPRHWPFVRGIHRWPVNSPHKASDAELWCFLWSAFEQTVE